MGSKVLLTLPELSRVNYFHLSSRPLLMVEQLLMNMKVDWVSVAVQTLHQLLGGQEVGFAVEDIDNLLSKYAEKALNFPFSLKERRSDSVIRIQESLCQLQECEAMSKSGSSELSLASFTGKISMPLFLCALWSTKKGRLFFFFKSITVVVFPALCSVSFPC